MAAQTQKNCWQKCFAFLNAYKPKSQLINPDHMEDYDKIQKQGTLRNYFCLKICSTINFPKKHPDFGGLETNQRHKVQT